MRKIWFPLMALLAIWCVLILLTICNARASQDCFLFLDEESGTIRVQAFQETWVTHLPEEARLLNTERLDQNTLRLTFEIANQSQTTALWRLRGSELYCEILSSKNLFVTYPLPFFRNTADVTDEFPVPVAEGVSYPVNDQAVNPYEGLYANMGYGITLPLFGQVNQKGSGYGFLAETPDHFEIKVTWDSQKTLNPRWDPEKQTFHVRSGRYFFFQKHNREQGITALAKWYRGWLSEKGYLVPLSRKIPKSGNPEQLVAAPHVWVWDDPLETAKFLKGIGVDRALVANVDPRKWTVNKEVIKQIHKMGYLTGKYDNYEDRWPKELSEHTEFVEGFPEGLTLGKNSQWIPAWKLPNSDTPSEPFQGYKLCSTYASRIIQRDLPRELSSLPYTTRFIDTLTGTDLRDCYNPAHSQDRKTDRLERMTILSFSSNLLLTGGEKGIWWAIPSCHYFMGMLSLNPYPPNEVEAPSKITPTTNPDYLRFDVGPKYRIPLFELVAHDCVLPTWYWGDGNNKHPDTWREKDLLTILYGGMLMWCFENLSVMSTYAEELASSYHFTKPALMAIGIAEMDSFVVYNESRTLQSTYWGNGTVVTVNFSQVPATVKLGRERVNIPPRSYHLARPKKD